MGGEVIPSDELDELFDLADVDCDGKFNTEEFFRFMLPK